LTFFTFVLILLNWLTLSLLVIALFGRAEAQRQAASWQRLHDEAWKGWQESNLWARQMLDYSVQREQEWRSLIMGKWQKMLQKN
jgi:hypothetical protein